jgi:hypothetical protein
VEKNLNFFDLKNKLCGISKVALVEYEWLIFKLHFGLDRISYLGTCVKHEKFIQLKIKINIYQNMCQKHISILR